MMKSSEINDLDQAIENLTHDLRYEHRAVEIVRAVNSHAALVEALEGAIEVMEFAYMKAERQPKEIAKARAALTLAKGA